MYRKVQRTKLIQSSVAIPVLVFMIGQVDSLKLWMALFQPCWGRSGADALPFLSPLHFSSNIGKFLEFHFPVRFPVDFGICKLLGRSLLA